MGLSLFEQFIAEVNDLLLDSIIEHLINFNSIASVRLVDGAWKIKLDSKR